MTCESDGTAWSSCAGESPPITEICSAPEDEDCDGNAPSCTGSMIWAKSWGGTQTDTVGGVAIDADGSSWMTGKYQGTISFGGGMFDSISSIGDMFLVKLDPDGNHVWSRSFGGPTDNDAGRSLGLDAAGNVTVTGTFGASIDFGNGPISSPMWTALFLASFDSSGNYRWAKAFPGNSYTTQRTSVVVERAGNVILAASVFGDIDFGDGMMPSTKEALYLSKFDSSGNTLWTKRFLSDNMARGTSVAVNDSGTIAVAGEFSGTCSFGGAIPFVANSYDAFVAQYDSSGNYLWSRQFGDANTQVINNVAIDSANNVIVAGTTVGPIDFGLGPIAGGGGPDVFIAKLDASGNPVWSKSFGDGDGQQAVDDHALSIDHAGDIVWTGQFRGQIDFGGNTLDAGLAMETFVVKLNSSGNHLWSRQVATAATASIAIEPSGNITAAGSFYDPIDFGGGPLTSNGENDTYLVKLTP